MAVPGSQSRPRRRGRAPAPPRKRGSRRSVLDHWRKPRRSSSRARRSGPQSIVFSPPARARLATVPLASASSPAMKTSSGWPATSPATRVPAKVVLNASRPRHRPAPARELLGSGAVRRCDEAVEGLDVDGIGDIDDHLPVSWSPDCSTAERAARTRSRAPRPAASGSPAAPPRRRHRAGRPAPGPDRSAGLHPVRPQRSACRCRAPCSRRRDRHVPTAPPRPAPASRRGSGREAPRAPDRMRAGIRLRWPSARSSTAVAGSGPHVRHDRASS